MATDMLVAYFSVTGTTEKVAEKLAEAIGADLFRIAPLEPYATGDLNWNDKASRSSIEMADELARPDIIEPVPNLDQYRVVFVGFPIWWYIEPRIIDTFLEYHDFDGKIIVPFATSGGSGMGRTRLHMEGICPRPKILEGAVLNPDASVQALEEWAQSLPIWPKQ